MLWSSNAIRAISFGTVILASGATFPTPSALAQDRNAPVKFKQFVVEDAALKQPAFTMLVPSEWKAEGAVVWRLHAFYPAAAAFTATKPGTVEQIVVYPHIPFVDGVRQAAASNAAIAGPDAVRFAVNNLPEGGNYMGNEIRILMTPAKYVEDVVIQRLRKDITNYKIVKVENMPEWAKSSPQLAQAVPGISVKSTAARVRVEYAHNGRTLHEDFYVLLSGVEMLQCNFWGAESTSSVRAEAGQLDKLKAIHQTVVHSMAIDEKWFGRYMQVCEVLQDTARQQQQHVMEISRIIKSTNDHVSKTISDTYWTRQKSLEISNQQFSNSIRGVEQYVVPGNRTTVTLPSGYDHAWVNGVGEYVLSNDPSFDPNRVYNGNWKQVKKAR